MFCAAIYTNLNPVILMGIWQFLKNNPIGWENETEDCIPETILKNYQI